MKVRNRTVEYEARQFTKENAQEIADWCKGQFHAHGLPELILTDKDGAVRVVEYGDWILSGEAGFEVCKKDRFAELFEEVK